MSGPVSVRDAPPVAAGSSLVADVPIEIRPSRTSTVGGVSVRRALPQRGRRTVGAWCFVDHFGPTSAGDAPMLVGPHPHIGLHTVTWLFDGEVLHRDSLGSEQLIRPGQLNLMTAGRGVAHAEESPATTGSTHGVQLWVAQPRETRDDAPAFEHHDELAVVTFGAVTATVFVGALAGIASPARSDTPLVGVELSAAEPVDVVVPVTPAFEHALLVIGGRVHLDGHSVAPDVLAYLPPGASAISIRSDAPFRALLLGGEPFEPILMWWNYVARTQDEINEANDAWANGSDRFGEVASLLPRIEPPHPPWLTSV